MCMRSRRWSAAAGVPKPSPHCTTAHPHLWYGCRRAHHHAVAHREVDRVGRAAAGAGGAKEWQDGLGLAEWWEWEWEGKLQGTLASVAASAGVWVFLRTSWPAMQAHDPPAPTLRPRAPLSPYVLQTRQLCAHTTTSHRTAPSCAHSPTRPHRIATVQVLQLYKPGSRRIWNLHTGAADTTPVKDPPVVEQRELGPQPQVAHRGVPARARRRHVLSLLTKHVQGCGVQHSMEGDNVVQVVQP